MKKSVAMLLFSCLFFFVLSNIGHAATAPNPKLFLDGKRIVSDVEPFIKNGATFVPVAILSDTLGYDVKWEKDVRRVTIKKESKTIQMTIDEKTVYVNGKPETLDHPPQLLNWRTMVPLRFVGTIMGLDFKWESDKREVYINSPKQPIKPEGYIKAVELKEDSLFVISYSGKVSPKTPFVLKEKGHLDRLVIDFPNTDFSIKHESGVKTEDNPYFAQYRYSTFSSDPLTARFVVEMKDKAEYTVSAEDGIITVQFAGGGTDPGENPGEKPDEGTEPGKEEPGEETGNGDGEGETGEGEEVVIPPKGKKYRIVLDAGHGGTDSGAVNKDKIRMEKDFNHALVAKMKALLDKDERFEVFLSRPDDVKIELTDRAEFANKLNADIFVSIHVNSFTSESATGSETYYYNKNSEDLAKVMQKYLVAGTGLNNRGVKTAGFVVIKQTKMPAVLLETGYISNPKDVDVLFNDSNQNKIADELVKGIKDYFKLK